MAELVFLGIALLFIPGSSIITREGSFAVCLLPLTGGFISTPCHYAAMILNFLGLGLALVAIFLFRKRELQLKFSYVSMILWCILTCVTGFCPLVEKGYNVTEVQGNYSGIIIGIFAIAAAFLAARFIRKDIDLLKSADRIR